MAGLVLGLGDEALGLALGLSVSPAFLAGPERLLGSRRPLDLNEKDTRGQDDPGTAKPI